jgi:hypothetical protein
MESPLAPANRTRESWQCLEALILGTIELWQIDPALAGFYYYGELIGFRLASERVAKLEADLTQAEADRDRYYRAADRGGFSVPIIKHQGATFAELEALRNQTGVPNE